MKHTGTFAASAALDRIKQHSILRNWSDTLEVNIRAGLLIASR